MFPSQPTPPYPSATLSPYPNPSEHYHYYSRLFCLWRSSCSVKLCINMVCATWERPSILSFGTPFFFSFVFLLHYLSPLTHPTKKSNKTFFFSNFLCRLSIEFPKMLPQTYSPSIYSLSLSFPSCSLTIFHFLNQTLSFFHSFLCSLYLTPSSICSPFYSLFHLLSLSLFHSLLLS